MRHRHRPRGVRLSTLLVTINVALLLLAVTGVALLAAQLLQQLAHEQALARVSQAGLSARQATAQAGEDLRTAAQVLAERPTLRTYLATHDGGALTAYLGQYCGSSHLDGCAIIAGGSVLAEAGIPLSWAALRASVPRDDAPVLLAQDGGPLLVGGWATVPQRAGAVVMVADVLGDAFARQISGEIALPVVIMDRQDALTRTSGARRALLERVLTTGQPMSAYMAAEATYLALQPLRAPSGEVVGIVETTLPATATIESVRRLVQTLLLLTLGVGALAALISFVVGRLLGRPLLRLAGAAALMGHGDLSTPVPPEAGTEIGMLATTLEEMRRQLLRLTEHLRAQQAEAQAILTGIVEGVFTVDRGRRIRYLNPQAAAMLGVAAADAIGRFCGDVLRPRPDAIGVRPCEANCPIVHARFRGGACAAEHLLLAGGARRTVILSSAAPVAGQQVLVLRDETEVEAARRLRDAVLANVSHEFKTPLAAQLASIELLLDQLPGLTVEEIGRLVLAQQRGALRLTQLIDNLLESVRIEAGTDRLRRQSVALEAVVEEALEMMRPLLVQRGQEVRVDLPRPLPAVTGDAPRLTQVFVNLLANAHKFAPARSTIRIGGACESGAVTLWLEDAGPGLPPQGAQSLFERFVRAAEQEPDQSGLGLGLWIVKSIVERHGGMVEAQRASAGTGTRMCVTLPVRGDAA